MLLTRLARFFLHLLLPLAASAAQERFYIGTYTGPGKANGIYTGLLDTETGRIGGVKLAVKANNPGYLAIAPNGSNLYAVTSDNGGSISAFGIGADGALNFINSASSGGAGPCHVSVDPSGKYVFAADYSGGSIASVGIQPGGGVGAQTASAVFQGSGPDPARQKKPFGHFVTASPDGRFVYACDLGSDHVWTYQFDAATGRFVAPVPPGVVPPGSGPRHLAFGPGANFVYVNGEMGRNITTFRRDAATGALSAIQTLPLIPGVAPAPGITTAEIICHPSGKWLYVSSRGDDILAVFAIGADGKLTFVQDVPCGVKFPRGFGIDPTGRWLIVAGQNDGGLAVHAIDPATGKLTSRGAQARVPSAICVIFAPAATRPNN
jgi:6-phosphogluconolactonase